MAGSHGRIVSGERQRLLDTGSVEAEPTYVVRIVARHWTGNGERFPLEHRREVCEVLRLQLFRATVIGQLIAVRTAHQKDNGQLIEFLWDVRRGSHAAAVHPARTR